MATFLIDGPNTAEATILLAHGAGSPMDSPSLNTITKSLVTKGLRVARFEFDYMASRRSHGTRRPCPRGETLKPEYVAAVDELAAKGRLVIGGKSLGGRVASMVADQLFASGKVVGLLCLGYPFHPIGKPNQLRTAHLAEIETPTLIVQGTRDELGTLEEVSNYTLSRAIEILWLEDGDHDLKPRKAISGLTANDHMLTLAERVAGWSAAL